MCDENIAEFESQDLMGIIGNFHELIIFFRNTNVCFYIFNVIFDINCRFSIYFLFLCTGCTKTHRGVKYAVISKGKRVFTLVNSIEMIEKHPIYLLHFLQSRVEFDNQRSVVIGDIVNSLTPIGPPKILGKH